MRHLGINPLVIISALISAYDKGKDPWRALVHFAAKRYHGITPAIITFNTLISACEKG